MQDILHYQTINDHISIGGQINPEQMKALKEAGFTAIVNLTPKNNGELATQLGMYNAHIPIDCSNLQPEQYEMFKSLVDAFTVAPNSKVYVHCGMNVKSSGFVYIYRQKVLGHSKDVAEESLKNTPGHEPKWREYWAKMGV